MVRQSKSHGFGVDAKSLIPGYRTSKRQWMLPDDCSDSMSIEYYLRRLCYECRFNSGDTKGLSLVCGPPNP